MFIIIIILIILIIMIMVASSKMIQHGTTRFEKMMQNFWSSYKTYTHTYNTTCQSLMADIDLQAIQPSRFFIVVIVFDLSHQCFCISFIYKKLNECYVDVK